MYLTTNHAKFTICKNFFTDSLTFPLLKSHFIFGYTVLKFYLAKSITVTILLNCLGFLIQYHICNLNSVCTFINFMRQREKIMGILSI